MKLACTAAVVVLAIIPLARPGQSEAQEAPFDPAIDLQLFEYATGPKSFLTVPDAELATHGQFQVDMMMTYLTSPLVVFSVDQGAEEFIERRTEVVENLLAAQLTGGIGYKGRFQFGVALPLVLTLSGEGLDPATGNMAPSGLQATGVGDLRGEAKFKLLRSRSFNVAAVLGIALPTSVGSSESNFLGDNTPNARIAGASQWRSDDRKATVGVTAGFLLRKPRRIYETEVGQQLTYGAAASYWVHQRVGLTAETFGRSGIDFNADAMPLEAALAARVRVGEAFTVIGGGGAGIVRGIGSPGLRMFISLAYAPDFRDQDGDGIGNNRDHCPLLAEDIDGYEDGDGCPDHDNDGDQTADSEDKCPMVSEDIDGFQDDDGCPDLDNDGDGFPDLEDTCPLRKEDGAQPAAKDGCPSDATDSDQDGINDALDKCPNAEEDADGFQDEDGCPDLDNDGDGVADDDDLCGTCAEDKDGFQDEDGCPDPDNDLDGIADAVDQCPLERETINGISDADGCPDSGGKQLAVLDGDKLTLTKSVSFTRRDELRKTDVIDQAAAVMLANPNVVEWRVVVVAKKLRDPEAHRAKSQVQAEAIKARLVQRGVTAPIQAIGAAADRQLTAIVVLDRVPIDPDSFCPAP